MTTGMTRAATSNMTRITRTMATTTPALRPPWLDDTSDCVGNSEEDGFRAEATKLAVNEEEEAEEENEKEKNKEEKTEEEEEKEEEEEEEEDIDKEKPKKEKAEVEEEGKEEVDE